MPLPTPTFDPEFPIDTIPDGYNARSDTGGEESLRELGESLRSGQLQAVGVNIAGTLVQRIWGGRRIMAARLVGLKTLKAMVYRGLTERQVRIAMGVENLQRADLTEVETYLLCKELMTLNASWSRVDLARHLSKSPGMITRYLCPDDLIPKGLQAFLDGKFGFTKAYSIAKAPDQEEKLRQVLGGSDRATRVTIPLASNGTVTVASKPGEEIDLEGVKGLLTEALKAVKAAEKRGISAATFSRTMKDIAASN